MERKALTAYFLAHRDDDRAFWADGDTLMEPPTEVFPAPESIADLTHPRY